MTLNKHYIFCFYPDKHYLEKDNICLAALHDVVKRYDILSLQADPNIKVLFLCNFGFDHARYTN